MKFRIIHSGCWFHVWNVKAGKLVTKLSSESAAVRFVSLIGGEVVA